MNLHILDYSCVVERRDVPHRLEVSKMSGAASAIFLLDMKGRVLIWRDYRGDVSAPQAERAFAKLMEGEVWSV